MVPYKDLFSTAEKLGYDAASFESFPDEDEGCEGGEVILLFTINPATGRSFTSHTTGVGKVSKEGVFTPFREWANEIESNR